MTERASLAPPRRRLFIRSSSGIRSTGKKVIYVNTDFTAKINELPALEGERVLQFLVDHCNKPEWTCRFRWTRAFDRVLG